MGCKYTFKTSVFILVKNFSFQPFMLPIFHPALCAVGYLNYQRRNSRYFSVFKIFMLKDNRFTSTNALFLAFIAIASIIGINQYTYGMYNHFISVPFIKSIIDPNLYPNDFLIAEKKYFYTYFNTVFAFLSKSLHVSLPVLFFMFYCASLYATLIAIFKISLTLFEEKAVAYFSVILLIFSFSTLGDIRTVESLFLERTFVLPLLLFAIYSFLHKKFVLTYALAGIAFLFHPLSAVYALAGIFLCSVFSLKEIGWKRFLASLMLLIIIISPVLYLKVQSPAPSLQLFHPDQEWLDLLRLRSAHHIFPFMWGIPVITQAALFIAGFILCMKYKPDAWHHRVIVIFCAAVLLMCLAGTIFTEFIPVSIIVQFQLFRSFVFLIYFGIIYYAHYFYRESGKVSPLSVLTLLLFASIFYNDNLPKFASFLLVLLALFPGYGIVQKYLPGQLKFYFPGLLCLLLGLGIGGGILKGKFTIQTAQEKNWVDIQNWARNNTPQDAAFIIAPNWEGFRVEGERTLYGDWKDGTQMFFNPAFGKEWMRRMKMLGYVDDSQLQETYHALELHAFEKIVAELSSYPEVYVVVMTEKKTLPLPAKYANAKFTVYALK